MHIPHPLSGIVVHDWPCDRCDADARRPCRALRSGKPRRVAHLSRWSTAAVFTLATRWLTRLPVWERLTLATRAVGSTGGSAPAAWNDVTALLWQADQLQKALVRRVVDDSDAFVDVSELRRPGLQLAAAMKEAGNLLRQQHLQDDPRRAEIDTMVLPDGEGPARRTLSELRAARDRGQVHVMGADMTRRAAAVAEENGTDAARWNVRWELSGRFDAEPIARPGSGDEPDAPAVRGWAAHPAVVADELGRWSTRPGLAEVTWRGAPPPSRLPRLCAFTPAATPHVTEEQAAAAFMARPELIVEIVAEIDSLRRSVPRDGVQDEVAARAARLQDEEPQLPDLFAPGDSWACTKAVEWVRTQAVVRTPDVVWGRFDRDGDEPDRWLPERTAELLAVGYADVPAYLTRHFGAHSESGAVQLLRIPGPAGPLYAVSAGSRRAHLCRVLGLPWMFAVTTMMSLPRRIETTAVTPPERGPEACRETALLWRGLLERGLVRGELIPRYSDWVVELRIEYALAPWMLLPADRATAYNQRYELLHPGALADAGIPDGALRSSGAWETWVTGA
ncbi:zinc finger domain-containing protein [Pseudonocardia adelaidensis]|uniref:DNA-binding phage zinc finger domain-containing protein n=1 Tax=Pseudonocardia adelaidensis TaxID=648754 RepID=A0ABP9N4G8_9PSEU